MKTLIFAILITGIALNANAQKLKESNVPSAVKTTFSSMYPGVKNVKWEKEDGKYEAGFEENKIETSVLFDANGIYTQKEVEIPVSELPDAIKNYVSANLSGKKIKEASKITEANGSISYEAEIGNQDYIFDQSGNLLKKESGEKGEGKEEGKEDDDDK
ncbi:MAG: PepSY-like domain-containing protein [Ignavibacteria bacterium]